MNDQEFNELLKNGSKQELIDLWDRYEEGLSLLDDGPETQPYVERCEEIRIALAERGDQ